MTDFIHYSVVGFDLDNTLFDQSLYEFEVFDKIAKRVERVYGLSSGSYAEALKEVYRSGEKIQSFDKAMLHCLHELPEDWEVSMSKMILPFYRQFVPSELKLFKKSLPLLQSFKSAGKKLVLITNGRVETQNTKIDSLSIRHLFDHILISDSYSPVCRKPDTTMFSDALVYFGIAADEMVYIGDDLLRDRASEELGIRFIHIDEVV